MEFHCFFGVQLYVREVGHDYFQTSRDRCVPELLLETRHSRMDFYTDIGTNSKYYYTGTPDRPKSAPSKDL
jgi:hypothetical protein